MYVNIRRINGTQTELSLSSSQWISRVPSGIYANEISACTQNEHTHSLNTALSNDILCACECVAIDLHSSFTWKIDTHSYQSCGDQISSVVNNDITGDYACEQWNLFSFQMSVLSNRFGGHYCALSYVILNGRNEFKFVFEKGLKRTEDINAGKKS